MTRRLPDYIRLMILPVFIFLLAGVTFIVEGQEKIGGIVNKYAKVNSVNPGYVMVGSSDALQFKAGDNVLLIQMQGVGIQAVQGSYGVNVQSVYGTPGGYEFMKVQSVNYATGRINFTRNVYLNNYDVASNVQLVQVPFYEYPEVTTDLTGPAWDRVSGKGGVIALIAARKLTLNADIIASGLGFSGAPGVDGIGVCVDSDYPLYSRDSYPETFNNAGLKGEGVAIHDQYKVLLYPNHAKGQGRNFTGGGGGNGWFSGGGGGSNRGRGVDGGLEKQVLGMCGDNPFDGGYGGMKIAGSIIQEGIFPGGGGGASTRATGSFASPGGNGGGIVIIIADTIDGNNHAIRALGSNATNATGDAGAGGGGAGGSIALSVRQYKSAVNIYADGGNAGINPGNFGAGGAGGGGLIWVNAPSLPLMITRASVNCGLPAPAIATEETGEIRFNFIPKLNGFLFNSIWTAVTGNRVDSVCSNVQYGLIEGTLPMGGVPPYTYRWERSITSETTGFTTAPGVSNQKDYTPSGLLSQTTWFRRVVTDNGGAITDISLPVQIIVHTAISNNTIGNPATLCFGQAAQELVPAQSIQGGNGFYNYSWQASTDNNDFTGPIGEDPAYLPPAPLSQTTWFRRQVNSGACFSTSNSVSIIVLDTVRNNSILTLPQEICDGMSFVDLSASVAPALGGGDNNYRFMWESSPDAENWIPARGVNNTAGYNPDETAPYFPGHQYFRRVVMSGVNDVCVNYSKPVLLSSYPVITNNTIAEDQTICSGTVPARLNGSLPSNGKGVGTYTYTWQDSSSLHSWTDIPGFVNVTGNDFTPPALTDTTSYRRIVQSSACMDISRPVTISVHHPVTGNSISLPGGLAETTICSGSIPGLLTGSIVSGGTNIAGDYSYQWSVSSDNIAWTDIGQDGMSVDYQPGGLVSTTWFRRRATSGECFSESQAVKITVLPSIANNTIASGQIVCKSDIPGLLSQAPGHSLSGGNGIYSYLWEQSTDGIAWEPAEGINNRDDGAYQPPEMTRNIQFRRNLYSGPDDCCSSVSNILQLVLDSLPPYASIYAGPDTAIHSFNHVVSLAAEPPFPGSTGNWKVISGAGTFDNENSHNTKVRNLAKGLNTFRWTITKGACKLQDDVDVMLYDMFIPEGFSPNDDPDGYNNTFIIKGLDLSDHEADLKIVNGSGVEVFRTSNRNGNQWTDWDGKNRNGNDLPEGTYYYLLTLKSLTNNQVFKKSGFVILKRY